MRFSPRVPPALPPDLALELTYRQTQKTMQTLRTGWVKSQRERSELDPVLRGLGRMQAKLEARLIQIAVLGVVGQGKSSLLNALLGESRFETGALHGVTQRLTAARWEVIDRPLPLNVELWDTPGLDEVDGADRSRLARRVAQRADLILFVISGDITELERQTLLDLRRSGKPLILVFNKVDQYSEGDRHAIYETLRSQRLPDWIDPDHVVMTAAAPLKRSVRQGPDGQRVVQQHLTLPDINALKTKIYDILEREGLALLTLNGLLYSQAAQNRILDYKLDRRAAAVDRLIWNRALAKAMAVAVNPIAVLDLVGGTIVDVHLVLSLAQLYGLPLSRGGAWRLLRAIGFSLATLSAAELMTTLGLGSLKSVLGATVTATGGTSLAPYISVAVTQGAIAGSTAYVVGQVTKQYLATGGQTQADLTQAIQHVLNTLEPDSVLARLRSELQEHLPFPPQNTPQKSPRRLNPSGNRKFSPSR